MNYKVAVADDDDVWRTSTTQIIKHNNVNKSADFGSIISRVFWLEKA